MADKTDIVTHGGSIVVMNGSIVMGPCDPAWELKVNGLSFRKFSEKIAAEKIRGTFSFVTLHTSWEGTRTSSIDTKADFMPLDGDFVDEGSQLTSSQQNGNEKTTSEIHSVNPLGISGFRLYKIGEDGRPSSMTNLDAIKPSAGVFVLDMAISAYASISTTYERTYVSSEYNVSSEGSGNVAKDFDEFLEFEIVEKEDGSFEMVRHEILSFQEMYDTYGDRFAFLQSKYSFGVENPAYIKGILDVDVTVTVEKKNGGS